mmetsp:Transcript_32173/g.80731  ORF Transcript_32173/g.80731 Transcript_32173/m.80731 type:complete len:215 (-) Transcript_32173:83-727(-)
MEDSVHVRVAVEDVAAARKVHDKLPRLVRVVAVALMELRVAVHSALGKDLDVGLHLFARVQAHHMPHCALLVHVRLVEELHLVPGLNEQIGGPLRRSCHPHARVGPTPIRCHHNIVRVVCQQLQRRLHVHHQCVDVHPHDPFIIQQRLLHGLQFAPCHWPRRVPRSKIDDKVIAMQVRVHALVRQRVQEDVAISSRDLLILERLRVKQGQQGDA